MASAGVLVSGSSFLSALTAVFNYAYLSSTTTAAATASLASGATTAAAYSAGTSAASLSTAVAAIASSTTNTALTCALLAAAANTSSDATAAGQYSALCLAKASGSPPPPPSAATADYTWLAPLIVCTVAGIVIISAVTVFVVRRFRSSVYATGRSELGAGCTDGDVESDQAAKQVAGGPEVVFMPNPAGPAAGPGPARRAGHDA